MHIELSGEIEPDGIHQRLSLERLAGGYDLLECHARFYTETFLHNDRPLVQVHAYKVCRDAGDFHTMLVSLPIRLRPGKTRQ